MLVDLRQRLRLVRFDAYHGDFLESQGLDRSAEPFGVHELWIVPCPRPLLQEVRVALVDSVLLFMAAFVFIAHEEQHISGTEKVTFIMPSYSSDPSVPGEQASESRSARAHVLSPAEIKVRLCLRRLSMTVQL